MIFESKYDIDEIVFIKDSRGGVKRGKISSIGIDNAKKNAESLRKTGEKP